MGLGLAWLLTLGAWLRSRNLSAVTIKLSERLDVQSLRAAQAEFVRACASGDARTMARKLLGWARLDRPALRCRNLNRR